MASTKFIFLMLVLQACPVCSSRIQHTEKLNAIEVTADDVSEKLVGPSPARCGHLRNMKEACFAMKSEKKGKTACEGTCSFTGGMWGKCACSDASQKCKSADQHNPGLVLWYKSGFSSHSAVKVDPDTKQWSYLKMRVGINAKWVSMGPASSLDAEQVMVPGDVSFVIESAASQDEDLAADLAHAKNTEGKYDPCDPSVMATYVDKLLKKR